MTDGTAQKDSSAGGSGSDNQNASDSSDKPSKRDDAPNSPAKSKPGEQGGPSTQGKRGDAKSRPQPSSADPGNRPNPGDVAQDRSESAPGRQSPETRKPGGKNASDPTGSAGNAAADDAAGGELGPEVPPSPPSPADMEYAKQATDMVLDYLEQTRDAPDQELMDKLNWTEEDLRRFSDRWQRARDLNQTADPAADPTSEWEETLKSLGLRDPRTTSQNSRDSSDSIRDLRDSGNRKPPPAAHRDAFDAFRRAIGRGR